MSSVVRPILFVILGLIVVSASVLERKVRGVEIVT